MVLRDSVGRRVAQVITFGYQNQSGAGFGARITCRPSHRRPDRRRCRRRWPKASRGSPVSHEQGRPPAQLRSARPDGRTICQTARLIRNTGVHACAVIMSSEPLTEGPSCGSSRRMSHHHRLGLPGDVSVCLPAAEPDDRRRRQRQGQQGIDLDLESRAAGRQGHL